MRAHALVPVGMMQPEWETASLGHRLFIEHGAVHKSADRVSRCACAGLLSSPVAASFSAVNRLRVGDRARGAESWITRLSAEGEQEGPGHQKQHAKSHHRA